jgi:cysteine desulfurase
MEKRTVYLDNSATTRPFDEVTKVVADEMRNVYGNPSSVHKKGIEAENKLKEARKTVAKSLQVDSDEIVFTSGGTEANNMALKGTAAAKQKRGKHIISSSIEHKSVLNALQALQDEGFEVTFLPVDSHGIIDLEYLEKSIRDDTILVSIMHVNNETGSIQPIDKISEILRDKHSQAVYHVDAVQSYAKIPLHPKLSGVDLATISSHKIHGPKGVGALYRKRNSRIKPLLHGGSQEYELRAGSENVPAISGFDRAVELNFQNLTEKQNALLNLKNKFHDKLLSNLDEVRINTPEDTHAAPHILNISIPGMKGEVLLRHLESRGIYVSTGSACTSGNNRPSHVLGAMGLDKKKVEGALRFSFSLFNRQEEIDYTVDSLVVAVNKLKKMANFR